MMYLLPISTRPIHLHSPFINNSDELLISVRKVSPVIQQKNKKPDRSNDLANNLKGRPRSYIFMFLFHWSCRIPKTEPADENYGDVPIYWSTIHLL